MMDMISFGAYILVMSIVFFNGVPMVSLNLNNVRRHNYVNG